MRRLSQQCGSGRPLKWEEDLITNQLSQLTDGRCAHQRRRWSDAVPTEGSMHIADKPPAEAKGCHPKEEWPSSDRRFCRCFPSFCAPSLNEQILDELLFLHRVQSYISLALAILSLPQAR